MKSNGKLLQVIRHAKRQNILLVGYLNGTTPKQFSNALKRMILGLKDSLDVHSLTVATMDRMPSYWACAMIVEQFADAKLVAIDTRDESEKSCIIVASWNTRRIGLRIANPNPDLFPPAKVSAAKAH